MTATLVLSTSALILGYGLVAGRSAASVRRFLWRLTLALAAIGLLYSSESLFSLGLRSVHDVADFGIDRVKGPLFGAATGQFILLPALGFALQELLLSRRRPAVKGGVILSLLITIIGLGSRAALLTLGIFVLMVAVILKSKKQRIVTVGVLFATGALAWFAVFSKADPQRVMSLESLQRQITHYSAWRILDQRGLAENLVGCGYGSIWPWYVTDARRSTGNARSWDTAMKMSPGGPMAYHPHSNLLMLVVELGVPGLLSFVLLWWFVIKHVAFNARYSLRPVSACAVLASCFSMFTDLCLFKNWSVAAIWWAFVFGSFVMAEGAKVAESQTEDDRSSRQGGAGPNDRQ